MKPIGIAADSNSGITPKKAKEMGILVLPMPFYINEECFYENVSLTREDFFTRLAADEKVTTSQPSPEAVMDLWNEGLKEYEKLLYFPMSSGLSGACNTARMLAEEPEFEGKVLIVDNGRVSTPMERSILDAMEMIEEGLSAERIVEVLEQEKEKMAIYIAVETLEYLKRGGRVSAAAAAVGSLLNIKPILKLGVGVLDSYKKSRGMKAAKREMLAAIHHELEQNYAEELARGEVHLLAATSAAPEVTAAWVEEIKEAFPGMEVLSGNLALSICCHTGEGALGVGLSCRPAR